MAKKKYIIGVDEVGRGCLAGPVIACAFAFKSQTYAKKYSLYDSKIIPEKKRERIFAELMANTINKKPHLYFGIGVVEAREIDKINIKNATKLAMQEALTSLFKSIKEEQVKEILIDGNDKFVFPFKIVPKYIIKGDTKIKEIQGASIIAKVFRDQLVSKYDLVYPDIGFSKHKGYGTKMHREQIALGNITSVHRYSFAPLRLLEKRD